MSRMTNKALRAACLLLLPLAGGCSSTGGFLDAQVAPWERGSLAKREMQWKPDAMEGRLRDHIYFSKEASSGGTGAAGGGCGCN